MNLRITGKIIIVSALMGALYGALSVILLQGDSPAFWAAFVSSLCGALLFGSTASALCRIYSAWKCLREVARQNEGIELCYRGVPHARSDGRDYQIAQLSGDRFDQESPSFSPVGAVDDQSDQRIVGARSPSSAKFELTICEGINTQDQSIAPKRQRVSAERLRQVLDECLHDSYLE